MLYIYYIISKNIVSVADFYAKYLIIRDSNVSNEWKNSDYINSCNNNIRVSSRIEYNHLKINEIVLKEKNALVKIA